MRVLLGSIEGDRRSRICMLRMDWGPACVKILGPVPVLSLMRQRNRRRRARARRARRRPCLAQRTPTW